MKTRLFKGFALGLALIAITVAPACKSTRNRKPPTSTAATDTSTTVPDISATAPTDTVTRVDTQPADFVNDQNPTVEELPRDVEGLNRYVQERRLIRDVFFGYDEAGIPSDGQAALSASADWLKANPQYNLLIEGHCDERGTEQYNLALGDRRANVVRDYLVALGIAGTRIRTVSYGEERPFEPGHDESSWSQNRRAHLVLTGSNP